MCVGFAFDGLTAWESDRWIASIFRPLMRCGCAGRA